MGISKRIVPLGITLGGGAARGLSHIGVLKVLSTRGISFPIVTGTSMGAIIGAAYVCGKLDVVEAIARSITIGSMSKWADLNLQSGALRGEVVKEIFRKFVGDTTFEELRNRGISFTVVAADLDSEKPVYISEGRIDEAVRASMSVPGIFEPVSMNGRVLVDGGLIDNVPVGAARALGARKVIGVEVYNPYDVWLRTVLGLGLTLNQMRAIRAHLRELVKERNVTWHRSLATYQNISRGVAEPSLESLSTEGTGQNRELSAQEHRRVRELIARLHTGKEAKLAGVSGIRDRQGWTALRAALAAMDIITSLLQQGREPFRATEPADLFIRPDVTRFHAHQFYRASHLIAEGERAAIESLPQINALERSL